MTNICPLEMAKIHFLIITEVGKQTGLPYLTQITGEDDEHYPECHVQDEKILTQIYFNEWF